MSSPGQPVRDIMELESVATDVPFSPSELNYASSDHTSERVPDNALASVSAPLN